MVGIAIGKCRQRLVEAPPLADVAVNGYRISSAGVCSSEDRAALLGELHEIRRYDLSIRDDLHVPELPDVKIQLPNVRPAHEDVGCSLNESLTGNNSLRGSRSRAARPAATRSSRDAAVASTEPSACCAIRYEPLIVSAPCLAKR